MFRYRTLALESDWDEFGYTDASDIEIESDILELGEEYEPDDSVIESPIRNESREVSPTTARPIQSFAGEAVVPKPASGKAQAFLAPRDRENHPETPTSKSSRSTSVVHAPSSADLKKASTKPTAPTSAGTPTRTPTPPASQGASPANPVLVRKSPGKELAPRENSSHSKSKASGKVAVKQTVSRSTSLSKPVVKVSPKSSSSSKPAAKLVTKTSATSQKDRAAKVSASKTRQTATVAKPAPKTSVKKTPRRKSGAGQPAAPRGAAARPPAPPSRKAAQKGSKPATKAVKAATKPTPSKKAARKTAAKTPAPQKRKR